MTQPLVIILMGSKSDEAHCAKIAEAARGFGLDVVTRIGSAHKTPEHALSILRQYEADPRPKVYITVAGRSNALSGFTDGSVSAPVIACPPTSESFGGADAFMHCTGGGVGTGECRAAGREDSGTRRCRCEGEGDRVSAEAGGEDY